MTHNSVRPFLLITGASSGIGSAIAHAAGEHYDLILLGRDSERLNTLRATLQQHVSDGHFHPLVVDMTDNAGLATIQAFVTDQDITLHGIIHSAGVFETAAVGDLSTDHIDRSLQLNLLAPITYTNGLLQHMKPTADRPATIIAISSIAAQNAFPGCGIYSASKAGLEAWIKSAREDCRDKNIRFSILRPGATDTPIWGDDCPFDRQKMIDPKTVAKAALSMLLAPANTSIDELNVYPSCGPL